MKGVYPRAFLLPIQNGLYFDMEIVEIADELTIAFSNDPEYEIVKTKYVNFK